MVSQSIYFKFTNATLLGEFDDNWIFNEPGLWEILWDKGLVNTRYNIDLGKIEKLRAILQKNQKYDFPAKTVV